MRIEPEAELKWMEDWYMNAAQTLERRIDNAMHELSLIRNEILLQKMQMNKRKKKSLQAWGDLSKQVALSWDSMSALQEVNMQREKTW